MQPDEINVWLPAIMGVIGSFVGAISTFLPNYILERAKSKNESEALKCALLAEISAMVQICARRKYVEGLRDVCAHLSGNSEIEEYSYTVIVPSHYSRIYQENCSNIGMLDKDIATEIVRFHQLLDAVVQDVTPGGVLSSGAGIAAYDEAYNLLREALDIGNKITRST